MSQAPSLCQEGKKKVPNLPIKDDRQFINVYYLFAVRCILGDPDDHPWHAQIKFFLVLI
jgi:hypothetical protein